MYDDDDEVDQDQDDDDSTDDSDQDGSDDQTDSGADSSDDNSEPAPHEVEASRGALGEMLGKLQDNGVDIDSLAADAGVDTTDINDMEQGDIMALAEHLSSTHPDLAQSVLGRFPVAQGVFSRFLG